MNFQGFTVHVANNGKHKYYAIVDGKKVYFGDVNYEHYHDKLGHYRHLNHEDTSRRDAFKSRHKKNIKNVFSPAWFADRILW